MFLISILATAVIIGYTASLKKKRFPLFVYFLTAFLGSAIGAFLSFGDFALFLKYPVLNMWTVPVIFSTLFVFIAIFADKGAIKKAIATVVIIITVISGLLYFDSSSNGPNRVLEENSIPATTR